MLRRNHLRTCRARLALGLATVLTVGGLVAPLGHFIHMTFEGSYAEFHTSCSHENSPTLKTPGDSRYVCPYISLFASLIGDADLDAGDRIDAMQSRSRGIIMQSQEHDDPIDLSRSARGPPIV